MLNVYIGKEHAGNLFSDEENKNTFIFSYLQECYPQNSVSLTMPVRSKQYLHEYNLHPIFDMNLPEGALLDRLRRRFNKVIPQFNDLKLLEIIGTSQIGRSNFFTANNQNPTIPNRSINELLLYDGTEGLFEDLLNQFATSSGISGAQPKVMIRDEQTPEIDRLTYKGTTHILKAWNPNEYDELAANEYFCMLAAKYSKLTTPDFQISKNRKFFIINRFDIINNTYFGFEDLCVLNGKTSEQKYDSSYENITKRLKEFISPENLTKSLEEFFKSFTLSCILRNGDAHLKNFGVIYENTESQVYLAPAYDIVTTTAYIPNDTLALTLGGSKRWPKLKPLLIFARDQCNFTKNKALELINEVITGVNMAKADLHYFIKQNNDFQRIGQLMLNAWAQGLKDIAE